MSQSNIDWMVKVLKAAYKTHVCYDIWYKKQVYRRKETILRRRLSVELRKDEQTNWSSTLQWATFGTKVLDTKRLWLMKWCNCQVRGVDWGYATETVFYSIVDGGGVVVKAANLGHTWDRIGGRAHLGKHFVEPH